MSDDPFARFERSRGGLLIPVLLFVLGAVPTAYAISALDPMMARHDAEVRELRKNAAKEADKLGGEAAEQESQP